MNREIYIFGHKNPDTDSICSAIAYAHLKREEGYKNARPYRLGDINRETEYALSYFKSKPPTYLEDAGAQLDDLELYDLAELSGEDPIRKAWDTIQDSGKPMIPVTDKENNLTGVIAVTDITKSYIDLYEDDVLMQHDTKFENLLEVLNAKVLQGKYKYNKVEGRVYTVTTLKDDQKVTDKDIIITGHYKKLQKKAKKLGAGCIIIAANDDGENVCHIDTENTAIVRTPFNFFKAIKMMNQSIPIKSVMTKDHIVTFNEKDYLDDVKKIVKKVKFRHFPILDKNGKLKGSISRRHLIDFNRKNVILVDHNEKTQSVKGLDQTKILEVIDHHRVADISTNMPLYYRGEPVGCTSTIIYNMYKEKNIDIPKKIAGLMLSAIISDTILFKSPTCTEKDKNAAKKLADVAGVDLYEYGKGMLIAGTSLKGIDVEDIYESDLKEFNVGKNKLIIGQVNTADYKNVLNMKEKFLDVMKRVLRAKNANVAALMITDILNDGSVIIFAGDKDDLIKTNFTMKKDNETVFLEGVLSRKKQIAPKLIDVLK